MAVEGFGQYRRGGTRWPCWSKGGSSLKNSNTNPGNFALGIVPGHFLCKDDQLSGARACGPHGRWGSSFPILQFRKLSRTETPPGSNRGWLYTNAEIPSPSRIGARTKDCGPDGWPGRPTLRHGQAQRGREQKDGLGGGPGAPLPLPLPGNPALPPHPPRPPGAPKPGLPLLPPPCSSAAGASAVTSPHPAPKCEPARPRPRKGGAGAGRGRGSWPRPPHPGRQG